MLNRSISYVRHDETTSEELTVAYEPGMYAAVLTLSRYEDSGEGILRVLGTSEPVIVAQRPAQRFNRTAFYRFTDQALAAWLAGKYTDALVE